MTDYNNKTGIVKKITPTMIYIDADDIPLSSNRAKDIVRWSKVKVGDDVEYNRHSMGGELIFLKVITFRNHDREYIHRDVRNVVCGQEGGGEMADMSLASQDEYELFQDGMI